MITEPRFQFNMAVLFNQKILNTEYWMMQILDKYKYITMTR